MNKSQWVNSPRLEIVIAALIAIVSTSFALVAWRINMVSSNAGSANRQGIIDGIKKQAFTNENWRQLYTEASSAENYAVHLAGIKAMEASKDPTVLAQAANLREYLLPNLQLLATPLATDPIYQKADGTYDLQKRFDSLEATNLDLRDLDPQASFQLAARYFSEQRWLTVVTVVLAISLFWLALAEISGKRIRLATMAIGAVVYGAGLAGFIISELIFFFLRGGVL
jgi:hypothetical protein